MALSIGPAILILGAVALGAIFIGPPRPATPEQAARATAARYDREYLAQRRATAAQADEWKQRVDAELRYRAAHPNLVR